MGRPKETSFSEYVDRMEHGGFQCKFCQKEFKGSISRFKSHLSGLPRQDIRPCEKVPDEIKQAALATISERTNKRRKTIPSSSSSTFCDQMELEDIPEEIWQVETSALPEMVNSTKGDELPTTELVGKEFKRQLKQILSCLMYDTISIIGIVGMVGVGKTELAKHVNNSLLKTPNTFDYVYWVTVPPNFSIHELQSAVAEAVGLNLSNVNDDNRRAARLSEAFRNSKCVVIFDDVWDWFPLKMVGVDADNEKCKLILTTTSSKLLLEMKCQMKIEVKCLDEEDAMELFELGVEIDQDIDEIVDDILNECKGLPLGIETMARNMKGVCYDAFERKSILQNMKRSIRSLENEKIFLKLRRSYDKLNDPVLKQCFLYGALFPPNIIYTSTKMIEYWIDEEIIKGKRSRQEELDEGFYIVNKLSNLNLSTACSKADLQMHPLMRHMALQIMEENLQAIVGCGEGLQELPEERLWSDNLMWVALHGTGISEIPPSYSPKPNCPTLKTLLLCNNSKLRSIPTSFLEQMHGLKVLNLSHCDAIEELPDSVSHLENLRTLILQSKSLRQVPSLANLRALKKLAIACAGIEQVPKGMKKLFNLRYLELSGSKIKEFPTGILPNLFRLQYLSIDPWSLTVKGEEMENLKNLEYLQCRVQDFDKSVVYVLSNHQLNYDLYIGDNFSGEWEFVVSKSLKIRSCIISYSEGEAIFIPRDLERLGMKDCHVGRRIMFERATKLEYLDFENCEGIGSCMLSFPPQNVLQNSIIFSNLRDIRISKCHSLKTLFPSWVLLNLRNLRLVSVSHCEKIEEIITVDVEQRSQNLNVFSQSSCLQQLYKFRLEGLPQLKSICSRKLVCNSLQYLHIIDCTKLEWIPLSLLSTDNASPHSSLKKIEIRPREWWERLKWENPSTNIILSHLCNFLSDPGLDPVPNSHRRLTDFLDQYVGPNLQREITDFLDSFSCNL